MDIILNNSREPAAVGPTGQPRLRSGYILSRDFLLCVSGISVACENRIILWVNQGLPQLKVFHFSTCICMKIPIKARLPRAWEPPCHRYIKFVLTYVFWASDSFHRHLSLCFSIRESFSFQIRLVICHEALKQSPWPEHIQYCRPTMSMTPLWILSTHGWVDLIAVGWVDITLITSPIT